MGKRRLASCYEETYNNPIINSFRDCADNGIS